MVTLSTDEGSSGYPIVVVAKIEKLGASAPRRALVACGAAQSLGGPPSPRVTGKPRSSPRPMKLRLHHCHLPNPTPYAHASTLQSILYEQHAAHARRSPPSPRSTPLLLPPPPPYLLTFQSHPTYTVGRRERGTYTRSQIAYLEDDGQATFAEVPRGGQITYHGPGQLTAYAILSLRAHGLTPRAYIRLLEDSVIATLAGHGVAAFTTAKDPGVWVSDAEKICAVGVHMQRYVTSFGIGLNVGVEVQPWFERIVACGLVGKRVTSLEEQRGVSGVGVEEVGNRLAAVLSEGLERVEGTVGMEEADVLALALALEGAGE